MSCEPAKGSMARSGDKADLFAYMNAYSILEVEYSATPIEIRRAYRQLAQQVHPDLYPQDSAGHDHRTARMAALNDAYHLIKEAPLRFHPASRRSDPDVAWSDAELDSALRRARRERVTIDILGVAVGGALGVFLSLAIVHTLGAIGIPGFSVYVFAIPFAFGLGTLVLGRRIVAVSYVIDSALSLSRLLRP
jgi:hypothetical protein